MQPASGRAPCKICTHLAWPPRPRSRCPCRTAAQTPTLKQSCSIGVISCPRAATLDVAWSEANENIVASCSGDGSIKLWDVSHGQNARPLRHLSVHTKEAVSLDWNVNHTQLFLSSSWDDTVKLWNATDAACVRSFERHTYCVYAVKWCVPAPSPTPTTRLLLHDALDREFLHVPLSAMARVCCVPFRACRFVRNRVPSACVCRNPQHGDIFLSVSGDCSAMVWDARQAAPSLILKAHPREILTGDWCKYNDCVVATGSIDKSIKVRRTHASRLACRVAWPRSPRGCAACSPRRNVGKCAQCRCVRAGRMAVLLAQSRACLRVQRR